MATQRLAVIISSGVCVCVCVCVCVYEDEDACVCVCVCVCERRGERGFCVCVSVCVYERVCAYICVCERECVCVSVTRGYTYFQALSKVLKCFVQTVSTQRDTICTGFRLRLRNADNLTY